MRTILGFVLALLAPCLLTAASVPDVGPPLAVPRAAGRITMDGKLDDAAWQQAAVLDTFYETYPADNTEPAAKTVVYLTYDDHDFYVGIHAFDPEPGKIRAPFVERVPLAALLALIAVPAAQAVNYCSVSYCANQPWNKPCGCPPESDHPGATSNCGTWTWSRVCWDGPVGSDFEEPLPEDILAAFRGEGG